MSEIARIRCTHVLVQVNLGYYDADGNLVGEETFPRSEGEVITAKLFHPHADQLLKLIEACTAQAAERLAAQQQAVARLQASPLEARNDRLQTESAPTALE
jgi:hypothetical protein